MKTISMFWKSLSIFAIASICLGCSTWGYKSRMGDKTYPPVPYQHVQILTGFPNQPFEQIGICSVSGGAFASGVDMYRKLQKSAALLGADAVVVTGEGVSHATLPGQAYTSGSAYTQGSATYHPYNRTVTGSATTTGYSNTTYMPPTTFDLPNNRGIAIKYIQSSSGSRSSHPVQSTQSDSTGTIYLNR
ncbi:MAG: hypothetical protein ABI254_02615 [Chthoniobacterales bacterium]